MIINDVLNILTLTQTEINALGTVDAGTIVYNSTTNRLETYSGSAWGPAGGGGTVENNYVNTSLFNPTVGAFATNGGQGANTLVGYCYAIHGQVTIDGLTITSTGGGGNLATAIYKYDSATAKFNKIASTETNSWNMGVSGFQTVSITQTTLDQGIYLNVVSTDTGRGGMSAYNQPKMDTPLGRIGTATSATQIMGITRGSVTYTYPMISQLDSIGVGYWNESTGFFNKFASFLLNQV